MSKKKDNKKKQGKKDLPQEGYPYKLKYKTEPLYLCCKICNCEK